MRRREVIAILGGAAASRPLVAAAQQQTKLPTIGFLGPLTSSAMSQWTAAFVQRLRELGWMEGAALRSSTDGPRDAASVTPSSRPSLYG